MAVTENSVMAAGNNGNTHAVSGATSLSTTGITVAAGTNRVLLACFNWAGGTGNVTEPTSRSVTWNSVSMTAVSGAYQSTASDPRQTCGWFYLINPATGAQTLAASWTGSTDCYCSAICFDGVEQTDATLAASFNAAVSSALTLNVTGTAGGVTVATHVRNGSDPFGSGVGTLFWVFDDFNPGGGGARLLNTNGTNAYDFNSGDFTGSIWATAGLHLVAASGGAAATRGTPFGHQGTAFNGGRTFHGILQREAAWPQPRN